LDGSGSVLLSQIGERLAALRLSHNLTQAELAEQAGLGLRTIQRLESGSSATHLSGFLRVCRILGLAERLDTLIPEPAASPIAELKAQRRKRKRASQKKSASAAARKWSWAKDA
jgi:transcriptional regulator with XRE-family HTH domain